jgi:folylpolyglutamate synthase/dihydropteroate synthase
VLRAVPCEHAEIVRTSPPLERRAAAPRPGGSVLVTGSFHTVGDALAALRPLSGRQRRA